jgi:hypothetical protein
VDGISLLASSGAVWYPHQAFWIRMIHARHLCPRAARPVLGRRRRRDLFAKLEPLETPRCPFVDLPTGKSRWGGGVSPGDARDAVVKPRLVAQIRFVEWMADAVAIERTWDFWKSELPDSPSNS